MRRSRFAEEQIIRILNEDSGRALAHLLIVDGRPRLRFYSETGSTTADITGGGGATR